MRSGVKTPITRGPGRRGLRAPRRDDSIVREQKKKIISSESQGLKVFFCGGKGPLVTLLFMQGFLWFPLLPPSPFLSWHEQLLVQTETDFPIRRTQLVTSVSGCEEWSAKALKVSPRFKPEPSREVKQLISEVWSVDGSKRFLSGENAVGGWGWGGNKKKRRTNSFHSVK